MAWFRLFACGEDFPVVIDGETIVCGFYTTRYVEAASASEAETIASEMLFEDPDLETPPGWEDVEGRIFFEEVEEVAVPIDINDGFSFFPMEGEEDD
ncbi:MAG: hypothetical protein ACREH4_00415 [Vitreimonas sp.]